MSDARGQARALTLLTRVVRSRERALREALDGLPKGEASPLARLPGTHFARLVIVTGIEPDSEYLLFSSTFDAGPEYLGEICARIPKEADAIWSNCDGYPGADDPHAFVRYMQRHRLRTNLFVAAYPDATLPDVQRALGLRERLIDLVPRAESMTPEELQASFHEAV